MLLKQYKYLGLALLCLIGLVLSIIVSAERINTEANFDAFIKIVRAFLFLIGTIHFGVKYRRQQLSKSNV